MPSLRGQRINQEMRKELSSLIRDLKDPRIPLMTSVTAAEVTKDQKFAKIYISVMGTEQQKQKAIEGLKNAASFLRREVGRNLKLRNTPELNFVLDNSIEYGSEMIEKIRKLSKEDNKEEN